jgi:hypothetical protein
MVYTFVVKGWPPASAIPVLTVMNFRHGLLGHLLLDHGLFGSNCCNQAITLKTLRSVVNE